MMNVLYAVSGVCLWILFAAIAVNFYFSRGKAAAREKKSIVETGSMLGFFALQVLLVLLRAGTVDLDSRVQLGLALAGTVLVAAGTWVNVAGRLALKQNWGNQIRIYPDHTLVQSGIYRFVRHPLYASTILMLYGFSFLFANWAVFVLNTLVFIPFMRYRAKQEERILAEVFPASYDAYRRRTGMLFPRLKKGGKNDD